MHSLGLDVSMVGAGLTQLVKGSQQGVQNVPDFFFGHKLGLGVVGYLLLGFGAPLRFPGQDLVEESPPREIVDQDVFGEVVTQLGLLLLEVGDHLCEVGAPQVGEGLQLAKGGLLFSLGGRPDLLLEV